MQDSFYLNNYKLCMIYAIVPHHVEIIYLVKIRPLSLSKNHFVKIGSLFVHPILKIIWSNNTGLYDFAV